MAADEGLRSGMDNLEGTLNSVAECATLGVVARELSSNQFRDLRARHAQTKWAAEEASQVRMVVPDDPLARQADYVPTKLAANDGQPEPPFHNARMSAFGY